MHCLYPGKLFVFVEATNINGLFWLWKQHPFPAPCYSCKICRFYKLEFRWKIPVERDFFLAAHNTWQKKQQNSTKVNPESFVRTTPSVEYCRKNLKLTLQRTKHTVLGEERKRGDASGFTGAPLFLMATCLIFYSKEGRRKTTQRITLVFFSDVDLLLHQRTNCSGCTFVALLMKWNNIQVFTYYCHFPVLMTVSLCLIFI